MDDMEMGHIMEKEAPLPAQDVSIDRCCSPALVIPSLASVVRQLRIGMMEVRDQDEPVRDELFSNESAYCDSTTWKEL